MNTCTFKARSLGGKRRMAKAIASSIFMCLWCGYGLVGWADGPLPEYQVKALFLLNFTKYVDWPPNAFAGSNTPVTIGVFGESKLGEALKNVVAGKSIGGRAIAIRQIQGAGDFGQCQILFISDAESSRIRDILENTRALPVLTVGEDEAFGRNGGIINFVLKNGNVRIEIDLAAARKAGLAISSRLLAVADVVKGKTN
jgi:hypothetical protein